MGLKQPSIVAMEQREADKSITLETLEKAANAVGCDVFYAFVPKDSFEKFVDSKRRELVNRIITETNLTMSLEEQGLSKKEI
ncbi:MAG: XRE family transcriptional regulator, partial [Flammeovirgaceae bacterium]